MVIRGDAVRIRLWYYERMDKKQPTDTVLKVDDMTIAVGATTKATND